MSSTRTAGPEGPRRHEHSADASDQSAPSAARPPGPVAALAPPFPLSEPACERVARALAVLVRTDDAAVRELCAAVGACAAELHAQGMAWEAAVPTMQAFVRHTAAARAPPGTESPSWVVDVFMEQIDHWCVVAYCRCEIPPD